MPTFPKYRGELPQCLNPRNIRHYFLLAYWVYFRPTALHCYLYEASPECYRLRGLEKIRRTWKIPAYKSLYLMSIPVLLLFMLILGLVFWFLLFLYLQVHISSVYSLVVTLDEKRVVSASADKTLRVWNLETGALLHILKGHTGLVDMVTLTPDRQKAVSASEDRTLKVWDLQSGKLLRTLEGHTLKAEVVVVTSDGQQVVSAGVDFSRPFHSAFSNEVDSTVKVWNLESGKLMHTLSVPEDPIILVAVTPDGQRTVLVSYDVQYVQHQDGSFTASTNKLTLQIWDLKNWKLLRTLSGDSLFVDAVAITPDGRRAVLVSNTHHSGILEIWDLERGRLLRTSLGIADLVHNITLTPDGQRVIVSFHGQITKVWDLKNGKLLHTLTGHTRKRRDSIAVAPDGQRAVLTVGRTLEIWDLEKGRLLHTLSGHTSSVNAVALTPDGKHAVSASDDNTMRVWDLEKGKSLPLCWNGIRFMPLGLLLVMLCVLTAILFPITLTLSTITFGVISSLISGLGSSLVFSTVFITATTHFFNFVATGAGFYKLGIGIPLSTEAFYIPFTIGFLILFGLTLSLPFQNLSRKAFGVLGSVIAIMVIGIFAGVVAGIFVGLQEALKLKMTDTVEILNGIAHGILNPGVLIMFSGAILGLAVLPGSSRLLFYPVQLVQALYSQFRSKKHPVEWDESLVLPLPGTRRLISQRLEQNEVAGLDLVNEVVRNSFQRSAVQKALKIYLHNQAAPLHLLYKLLTYPDLNTYIVTPFSQKDWEKLPTTGYLLLGELSGQWVDCSSDWANRWSERLIYRLTRFRRDRHKTSLTRFAQMLYRLLDRKTVEAKDFNLSSYYDTYDRLTIYPGGEEIANSFRAMATFLDYDKLSSLLEAVDIVKQHGYATLLTLENGAIRPTVLTSLVRLGEVGAEIAAYQDSTTQINQQSAILRATGTLEELEQYVTDEVFPPEQAILQEIIVKWRKLVTEEGGIIGRATEAKPVTNPYIAGNPVTGTLFVGRKDIMRRLEEIWSKEKCESVVLFGHRRMGKTSILKNLGARFGAKTIIVDFNMQGETYTTSTADLLYHLAIALYDSLPSTQQQALGELQKDQFTSDHTTTLKRFLNKLDKVRDGLRFIVTIDEFERIEQKINKNQLEPGLLDFFRYLIQKYDWFIVAFAGLHNLQEMTQDYWNPLFGSVTAIKVTFLSHSAAYRLITQPSPDFELDYDQDAIAHIIELTNGQPFLVQLICRELVTRFNAQFFEEGIERERRFTLEDVKAVINTPDFYQGDSNNYFNGVWAQAEEPAGQLKILKVLWIKPYSAQELAQATSLSLEQVNAALETLQRHDVIQQQGEQYVYTVELMRRWVAQKEVGDE